MNLAGGHQHVGGYGHAHPLADCALRNETATNQVYFATITLSDVFPVVAAMRPLARTHGAMGYSAETGAYLFLRRAVTLRQIGGRFRLHERAMLAELD